jgi:hypothetical protein
VIPLASATFDAQNLLKRDDIRIDLLQDIDDAARPDAAIQSTAFMYVVGGNSKNLAGLSHVLTTRVQCYHAAN